MACRRNFRRVAFLSVLGFFLLPPVSLSLSFSAPFFLAQSTNGREIAGAFQLRSSARQGPVASRLTLPETVSFQRYAIGKQPVAPDYFPAAVKLALIAIPGRAALRSS